MPIEVEIGNDIIEFPDNMSNEDIEVVLRQQYPPEQEEGRPQSVAIEEPQRDISSLESALAGAGQGATANFADELGAKAASKFGGGDYRQKQQEYQDYFREAQKQNPKSFLAGEIGGSLAGLGKVSKALGLGKTLAKGNIFSKIGKSTALGGATGAVYGAGGADPNKIKEEVIDGAKFGAVASGALQGLGSGARAILAPKIADSTAALGRRAKDLGVPLRVDQISPSPIRKTIQKVSQEIPGAGTKKFEELQRRQYMRALAKTLGQNSDDLGPDTINAFKADASNKFGSILKGAKINVVNDDIAKLQGIKEGAKRTLGSDLLSVVNNNVDDVIRQLKSGNISGEKVNSIRSGLLKTASKAQGGAKGGIGEVIGVLDDVIERSVPGKKEALTAARKEWRNFKTLEPLLEKSTDGSINPTQVLNRAAANKYIKGSTSAVGQDDLVDLGRIGKEFLPRAGGSDTAQKMGLLFGGGAGIANPIAAGKAAMAILPSNRMYQSFYNNNQLLVDALLRKGAMRRALGPRSGIYAPAISSAAIEN